MYSVMVGALVICTYAIAYACDIFEPAAAYIGRNMAPGVKGATINAIGSSMPELCAAIAFLFFVGSFMIGPAVSVTAGSAIFNSAIIPMMVIFTVIPIWRFGMALKITEIKIDKKSIIRDFSALIIAESALIYILGTGELTLMDCQILIGIYFIYMLVLSFAKGEKEEDIEVVEKPWFVILKSTALLIVACYILAELILAFALVLGVHPIITALFIGAAASSVPDTILSVKDARKGNYEDAIANALGSNTFDICIALGGPLFVYILINGPVAIPDNEIMAILRAGLWVLTLVIAAIFIVPETIKKWHGFALLGVYALWAVFALNTEFNWF